MNDEKYITSLGFVRYPEWDFEGTAHYRLIKSGITFRAFVEHNNPPVYTILGVVVKDNGIVDRWRDCVSAGSVGRKIDSFLNATGSDTGKK